MDESSFSVREGGISLTSVPIRSITPQVRRCLWNLLYVHVVEQPITLKVVVRRLFSYLHLPLDQAPDSDDYSRQFLKSLMLEGEEEWYFYYDVFEKVLFTYAYPPPEMVVTGPDVKDKARRDRVATRVNAELARAGVPYRFVGYQLSPIESDVERAEVAAATSRSRPFVGARTHTQAALSAFNEKPNPRIRDSIQESIHAVESAIKTSSGIEQGGISKALNKFSDEFGIHPALKNAISNLYGFGSDKPGLRHPLLTEVDDLTAVDARMMLVTASALVNWVISKSEGIAD